MTRPGGCHCGSPPEALRRAYPVRRQENRGDFADLPCCVRARVAASHAHIDMRVSRLFALLRPGGRLLMTDYCAGDAPPSPGFQAYVTQRGYKLVTPAVYGDLIRAAGFQDVVVEDRTIQAGADPMSCDRKTCCTLYSIAPALQFTNCGAARHLP